MMRGWGELLQDRQTYAFFAVALIALGALIEPRFKETAECLYIAAITFSLGAIFG